MKFWAYNSARVFFAVKAWSCHVKCYLISLVHFAYNRWWKYLRRIQTNLDTHRFAFHHPESSEHQEEALLVSGNRGSWLRVDYDFPGDWLQLRAFTGKKKKPGTAGFYVLHVTRNSTKSFLQEFSWSSLLNKWQLKLLTCFMATVRVL